jgi:hypothetical protein
MPRLHSTTLSLHPWRTSAMVLFVLLLLGGCASLDEKQAQ